MLGAEVEVDFALDQRAGGNAARGRHARDDGCRVALGLEAIDGNRSLGDGIDLAIGTQKRRH